MPLFTAIGQFGHRGTVTRRRNMSTLYSERVLKYHADMTTATRADHTYASSEVSRNPAAVFDAAEQHPIRVTRRDGADLVLMSHREADARDRLLELAAQLIAATTDDAGTLAERLADRLPWMLALSPSEQEKCAAELIAAARASFATGQAHRAITTITAWRETALVLAAGLGAEPVEWLAESELVERP
jgi:dsDNA-binding SOS-regulon protein